MRDLRLKGRGGVGHSEEGARCQLSHGLNDAWWLNTDISIQDKDWQVQIQWGTPKAQPFAENETLPFFLYLFSSKDQEENRQVFHGKETTPTANCVSQLDPKELYSLFDSIFSHSTE